MNEILEMIEYLPKKFVIESIHKLSKQALEDPEAEPILTFFCSELLRREIMKNTSKQEFQESYEMFQDWENLKKENNL